MNIICRDHVLKLLNQPQSPCVSLYAQFHPTNLEGKGDVLRWEQLVNQASEQLNQHGVPHKNINDLLAPARALPNTEHWRDRKQSLAMFLSESLQEIYHFSGEGTEEAWGDKRFHIRPLISRMLDSDRFYLLALSEKEVHFILAMQTH
jgi:hypothetical protein